MTATSVQSTGPSRLRLTPWALVVRIAWLTAALWIALVPTFTGLNVREPLRHHVVIEQILGLVALSFPLGLVYGAIVLPLLFMALQEVFGIVIGNGPSDVIIPLSFVALGSELHR